MTRRVSAQRQVPRAGDLLHISDQTGSAPSKACPILADGRQADRPGTKPRAPITGRKCQSPSQVTSNEGSAEERSGAGIRSRLDDERGPTPGGFHQLIVL